MIRLKEYRTGLGITQVELSMKSGVPQSVITGIETGSAKNPTIGTILKLAKALNCTVEELVQEDGPKEAAM